MSLFNLSDQNSRLDHKIVAGMERLSQVFRVLLWEKAKLHGLSPIQIQLLIFIQHHSQEKSTVSYLAQEFNLTKPTISDAIKILEQKQLIKKLPDAADTRSYTIKLTVAGKKIVADAEQYTDPLTTLVANISEADKTILWENISNLIVALNQQGTLSVQRSCSNCQHYSAENNSHFCALIGKSLAVQELRMDCGDFRSH